MGLKQFPFYKQPDFMDCGPTCLKMVAKHYGKKLELQYLRGLSDSSREGSSLMGLCDAAEKIGFKAFGAKVDFKNIEDVPLPCIAHWNQKHFVVLFKIKRNRFYVADPSHGILQYNQKEFRKYWESDINKGIVLALEPTNNFYNDEFSEKIGSKRGFGFLYKYFGVHKKLLIQLVIGLVVGSLFQLIFPFLTQSIVDVGVQNNDIKFIYLILIAQLMVFIGRTTIEIIRSWILLHISSRINISLVSDFFVKLMKLPISFFDSKMTGDIMQRINDHHRIESFLTSTSLSVLFSLLNLLVFSFVLCLYNVTIFSVFVFGSLIYLFWIMFFMKRRADLDYKRFQQNSENQSKIVELISGMQEIKLNNAERQKRWQWEQIQIKLFKINIKGLSLEQAQNVGSNLINELKNIIITFISAKLVVEGQITLGVMLSISYIIGQLNGPIIQLVSFAQSWQDAKISLERISEIHSKENEEKVEEENLVLSGYDRHISLKNISFKYTGSYEDFVLKNINFVIPEKKITAIVGSSGSGKTTLLKLLMKFYEPTEGEIRAGNRNLTSISAKNWRKLCGVVMQEGYIFSDSIANNITIGSENLDKQKLYEAVTIANIRDYIESLPLAYNTKIGMEGIGLSTGQKQRILIARAVYKNPDYLFFDEATSALDANNETIIMANLNKFFEGKTVVVIAHRLSTVKNADQILVLDKGTIVEIGNHNELTAKQGFYYNLVKNQLELGS